MRVRKEDLKNKRRGTLVEGKARQNCHGCFLPFVKGVPRRSEVKAGEGFNGRKSLKL
jgi:hypothetical protein